MSIKVKYMLAVVSVKVSERILKLAEMNNGTVTTAMVTAAGISRGNLKYLVDSGRLEYVSRGVYLFPGSWEDDFLSLQVRFKRGIFSHETALFFHDLTDQTPNFYHMTFPTGYNVTSPKDVGLRCFSISDDFYNIGVITLTTPTGNEVLVYNTERTLCDIVRPRSQVDIQVVTEAFKRYARSSSKNVPLLSEYAKLFKVEKKIRSYLEVLL